MALGDQASEAPFSLIEFSRNISMQATVTQKQKRWLPGSKKKSHLKTFTVKLS